MAEPLAGIRVIDISQGDGAPFCGMQLGDAGADVIKVEPLEGDWTRHLGGPFDNGDGPLFMSMNRNKRSIAIDCENEQGREIVRRLVRGADVLLENFPAQRDLRRLGFTYEQLSELNPRLVYCDVSYLGREGPQAEKPATDFTVQAQSGLTRFAGERGKEPVAFGENWVGVTAGMYATIAISAALLERLRSGMGQKIETSYLRAAIASQQNTITGNSSPDQGGSFGGALGSPRRGYKTKDGRIFLSFGYAPYEDPWAEFCKRFSVPEEVRTRYTQAQIRQFLNSEGSELSQVFEDAFKDKTTEEVHSILDGMGFMCAPVHDLETLFKDEGVLQQQMLLDVNHPKRGKMKTFGLVWKFTETPGSVRLAPPTLGEHTDAILREIGYNQQEIDALRSLKIVK